MHEFLVFFKITNRKENREGKYDTPWILANNADEKGDQYQHIDPFGIIEPY